MQMEKVAELALALNPTKADKKIVKRYRKDAEKMMSTNTILEDPHFQHNFHEVMNDNLDIDRLIILNGDSKKSIILHFMAQQGDVRGMEVVVAHAAAIDYPLLNEEACTAVWRWRNYCRGYAQCHCLGTFMCLSHSRRR
jgi:hypothetical protein